LQQCGRFFTPPSLGVDVTWGELFDRAGAVDATVAEIQETLARRRERRAEDGEKQESEDG
jgi:hypothetical protein